MVARHVAGNRAGVVPLRASGRSSSRMSTVGSSGQAATSPVSGVVLVVRVVGGSSFGAARRMRRDGVVVSAMTCRRCRCRRAAETSRDGGARLLERVCQEIDRKSLSSLEEGGVYFRGFP